MELRRGIPVSPGIAVGEAFVLDSEEFPIARRMIEQTEVPAELQRFQTACEQAIHEIRESLKKLPKSLHGEVGPIIESHAKIIQDRSLQSQIVDGISKTLTNAEYAVSRVFRTFIKKLQATGNSLFENRVSDLQDIEKRLVRNLLNEKRAEISAKGRNLIILAHDLTPSQTLSLDKEKVVGFAIDVGGPTSHTAILAKAMGIPAVVGLESIAGDVTGGDLVIIDGGEGTVIVNPDADTLKNYRAMERNRLDYEERISSQLRDLPARTLDGSEVQLLANIEFPEEVKVALEHGATGIGLYRSEFLFLRPGPAPGERDHLEAYRKSLSLLGGRELTIRTLDLGADKMGTDSTMKERNPFLGCRGIRLCLQRPDLFRPQLRALLRASAHGDARIMFPMVSSSEEIRQARHIVEQIMAELRREGAPFNDRIKIGIMVEVPAAAILADLLIKEVDFFSIGTNDLVQYTIAVDRANEYIAPLFQPASPAVLRLIKFVIEEGARNQKPVCMCGEMSGDVTYTLLLLGLGLKQFSMTPSAISDVKMAIRSVTMKEAREIAQKALAIADAPKVVEFLRDRTRRIIPDAF
ncbi:MAG: phosphoenolpyruvate--protein phosphotransferase [Planctomycetes bacterium]|nr:phosphoenolpyruvate--protein phosphotransferase [Planctomycetota bacterium]